MSPLDNLAITMILDGGTSPTAAVEQVLAATGGRFCLQTANTLAAGLWAREKERGADLGNCLAKHQDPMVNCIAARILENCGLDADALAAVDRTISALNEVPAELFIQRAKLKGNIDAPGRSVDLKNALESRPDHAFHARHAKFVERTLRRDWPAKRNARVAFLGSGTLSFLAKTTEAIAFRESLRLDTYVPDFGTWRQEILDPASGLYGFEPDIVVMLPNAADMPLPPLAEAPAVKAMANEYLELRAKLLERLPAHVIQFGLAGNAVAPWGGLEDQLPGGRARAVVEINTRLSEALPNSASYVAAERAASFAGKIFDLEQWCRAKLYPSQEATPGFAELIVAQTRAALGLAYKALVVDLDNTLWGGVIGEDGMGGIQIGAPSPVGEAHAALQAYLKELAARGVLLAVCSKNNPEDALAPFTDHDAMILRRPDFVAFVANWQDKASNITAIAEELGIGIDAIAFLDDNPVERAWVRERLPEVRVIENNGTPADMLTALDRSLLFESIRLTDEDKSRHVSYHANAAIRQSQADGGAVDDFLAGLAMRCTHGTVDPMRLARVAQLVNKTNQFNLTGKRYGEAEIARMVDANEWWWHWFSLSDRFGEHGLIGVMAAQAEGDIWRLDNWLMSCRVLGRKIEDFMMATLMRSAAEQGGKHIVAEYVPSTRNMMVRDLLPGFGFMQTETETEVTTYRRTVDPDAFGDLAHIVDCTAKPGL